MLHCPQQSSFFGIVPGDIGKATSLFDLHALVALHSPSAWQALKLSDLKPPTVIRLFTWSTFTAWKRKIILGGRLVCHSIASRFSLVMYARPPRLYRVPARSYAGCHARRKLYDIARWDVSILGHASVLRSRLRYSKSCSNWYPRCCSHRNSSDAFALAGIQCHTAVYAASMPSANPCWLSRLWSNALSSSHSRRLGLACA